VNALTRIKSREKKKNGVQKNPLGGKDFAPKGGKRRAVEPRGPPPPPQNPPPPRGGDGARHPLMREKNARVGGSTRWTWGNPWAACFKRIKETKKTKHKGIRKKAPGEKVTTVGEENPGGETWESTKKNCKPR